MINEALKAHISNAPNSRGYRLWDGQIVRPPLRKDASHIALATPKPYSRNCVVRVHACRATLGHVLMTGWFCCLDTSEEMTVWD